MMWSLYVTGSLNSYKKTWLNQSCATVCHNDLTVHDMLFSTADAKWHGHHRLLAADVVDDVRCVCTFDNQDLSLPLKTHSLTHCCA